MRIFVILVCLSLAACATPSTERSTPDTTAPPAVRNPAVVALIEESERQRRVGNFGHAASALERALRISPRDPALRVQLAAVRVQQGDPFQAKELARMAVVYADGQPDIEADAWDVIAAAERAIGNQVEATLAEQEATRLRGQ